MTRDSTSETTISLEDALLDLLETSLEELDWISHVDGLDNPARWNDGWVHGHLSPGALVRLSGPTQLLDSAFIRSVIDRAMGAMEIMALFSEGGFEAANRPKNERARLARTAATKLMGGLSPDAARQLGDLFLAFFGEEMVVRHFPCGPEHRRLALVGTLADHPGYLADSRSTLFAKYGSSPSEWTLLAQIATVPEETDSDDDDDDEDEDEDETDRAKFEGVAINILRGLESTGLTGAPAYPTITVTPIALYRGGAD